MTAASVGLLASAHQRTKALEKIFPPWVARLVKDGVRQHVVKKHLRRDFALPRRFVEGPVGIADIFQQERGRQRSQIALRHIRDKELHAGAFFAGRFGQCLANFRRVVAGAAQSPPQSRHFPGGDPCRAQRYHCAAEQDLQLGVDEPFCAERTADSDPARSCALPLMGLDDAPRTYQIVNPAANLNHPLPSRRAADLAAAQHCGSGFLSGGDNAATSSEPRSAAGAMRSFSKFCSTP